MSVTLALAIVVPSAIVPSATAQQAPYFQQGQAPVGGYGYGYPSTGPAQFGQVTSPFGDPGLAAPVPYPAFPTTQPQPYASFDRSRVSIASNGCMSPTYQTLPVPRPGNEVTTVGATTGGTSTRASDGSRPDARRGEERSELEALSPIEAAFQMSASPGQTLGQAVFDQGRTPTVPEPAPYIPVSSQGYETPRLPRPMSPNETETTQRQPAQMLQQFAPSIAGGSVPPATRFLGPFGVPLRQYGYAVFASYVSTFAPVDDIPVGPDYVVGPGDSLTVSMWGPIETTVARVVDRNGQIALPKVGDLRVWGLTFTQADRLIREQLGRYFRGFQTSVTMGRLRTVRVQVIGEVCQPGSFTLSSLATLTQALYAAGGPTKLGSLRSVRLLRNSHVVGEIDLYDFLLRGDRSRDYRLEAGDTIFIPTIGDVAAIAGEVKRPAIYEVKGDVRLADLVESAGGVTPTGYLKRIQIVRAQPSAERVTVDVDLSGYYLKGDMQSNPPVHSGDLVLVHKSDSRIYNTVKVDGAVKYPGVYELKPMMRLGQLVPADRLLPEAYADRVEISRRRPDYSVEILAVNLKKAWSGDLDQDLLLKANDEVTVRTEMRAARIVTLTGQVARPGTYAIADGERLSSVLERAGGFTARAYLKGAVFTRSALRKVEQEQLNAFVRVQEQRILSEAATTVVGTEKEDSAAVGAQVIQARRDFLRALASRVALGRVVINLETPAKLKNTAEDVVLVGGDVLDVPEPVDSVLVLGSVRNSTSVLHAPGAAVEYYVNRVGGYAKEADKKEIHIVRADGSAVAGFSNIRAVEPGDTIIVPRSEDARVKLLPVVRDGFSILGSVLSTGLSVAALLILFL